MLILHTSDIHLVEFEDDRWKTLVKLLEIGKRENIDFLVICGDLFDNETAAENLRLKIRKLFSNNDFNILILPGNHDKDSYKSGKYFGDDVFIFEDLIKSFENEDLRIWGMPFELINGDIIFERLQNLKEKLKPDKINILLFHGELLDTFFSRNDFGEEGEDRYMPVKLSYFKDLNFKYILGGHFHSRFDIWQIDEDHYFVYPGSPISITKKEIGKRRINLFEVGETPTDYPLDTPYYENVNIEFNPSKDFDPLKVTEDSLKIVPSYAKINLTLYGYINNESIGMSETELKQKINDIVPENCVEVNYEFKDVCEIIEDELYTKFLKKLKERVTDPEKLKKMQDLTIKSMMRMRL